MKLSDAMVLGDSLRSRNPDYWLIGNSGCAMGGAMLAVGKKDDQEKCYRQHTSYTEYMFDQWPWLAPVHLGEISNRFKRVCEGKETLESLIDYVRSIEPECGECLRFGCICNEAVSSTAEAVKETETVTL